jgi:pyruvate dehydrogenase complex dehydrogenase (E1) component
MARKLNDGRSFHVFKTYYDPAALERRLGELGWRANVWQTARYFIVGTAERATG